MSMHNEDDPMQDAAAGLDTTLQLRAGCQRLVQFQGR